MWSSQQQRCIHARIFLVGCQPRSRMRRDQGICERNTLQIAGTGVCEETRDSCRPVVGEMRRAAAAAGGARGSVGPAEGDAEAG